MKSIKERIIGAVEFTAEGCWIWTKAKQTNGYGSIGVGHSKSKLVHRASYEAFVGPIPDGMTLDHECHTEATDCEGGKTCRHRPCVNPDHLTPVTSAENNRRGLSPAAVNGRRTHCVNGHLLDEANTIVKRDGHRNCRTCQYASNRDRYRRRKQEAQAAA